MVKSTAWRKPTKPSELTKGNGDDQLQNQKILDFLLQGDPAIKYQTRKYLLGEPEGDLQLVRKQIALDGYGKMFLERQNEDFSFGGGFYYPKWTNTHYTLLDLRYLEIEQDLDSLIRSVRDIATNSKDKDGGIRLAPHGKTSDICVDGMFLNYASYFKLEEVHLKSVIDHLISAQLPDGGFNCQYRTQKVTHSSMHSTLSVLEGFCEYLKQGYSYRGTELNRIENESREFLLIHHLYRSDKTGEVISPSFLNMVFPPRWHYDILKALYYFADANVPYDGRMKDALEIISNKRNKDGIFTRGKMISGEQHFIMENERKSRWNTLRAMRVLKKYDRFTEE
ncbi:MAG: hypothetical protein WBI17_14540 [Clostridiaceae bacterium]